MTRKPGFQAKRISELFRLGGAAVGLCLLLPTAATAALSNAGFEDTPDLVSWTTAAGQHPGSVTVVRSGGASHGTAFARLSFSGNCVGGTGCTEYGPILRSSTFEAVGGEMISVDWRATNAGDRWAARGFIKNASTNATVATFFNATGTGANTAWMTATATVPSAGFYRLEFQVGSFDASFGLFIGAQLDLDATNCPIAGGLDSDSDGFNDTCDNCPNAANAGQEDADTDGFGDVCDTCVGPGPDDVDGDGLCAVADNCPNDSNPGQEDGDSDAFGDACDTCIGPGPDDVDGDGFCALDDNCPDDSNPGQEDADGSGIGDACNDALDSDGDEFEDGLDNCPDDANPGQEDADGSGIGDACNDALDSDGDEFEDGFDNCPDDANPGQEDGDSDGIGDACDGCVGPGPDDTDGDGVCSLADNCPDDPNPGQQNVNGDAYGDACQPQGVLDNAGCYAAFDTVAPPDGNEPTYSFVDISATGTVVTLSDDVVSSAIPVGFDFEFYGTTYNQLFISSNGFVTFLAGQSQGCCSGGQVPSPSSPNGIIAARWTDLYPPGAGSVRYQTLGTAPTRQFIVQFTNTPRCCGTSGQGTFQIILDEGSNEVLVQYANASDGINQTTAGIENAAGTIGLRWGGPGAISLTNQAVRYSPTTDMTDDTDGDSLRNCLDNCPLVANPGQEDTDSDGAGDACDCGDGILAAIETCDDGNASAGDGCDASCQTESGYECTTPGSPCTDIDECTLETDNCDGNAACTNSAGSFSCTCNAGYDGDGVTCTDIDECDIETDNCGDDASCFNSPGAFFCLCNDGFIGNGITCDPAHYVGYKIRIPTKDTGGAEIDNKFPRGWVITVNDVHLNDADADDPENFEVKKAKSLLNPAQKNLEPAPDLNGLHYLRYQMKSAKESIAPPVGGELVKPPKHVKRVWQLQNQFGTINVESKKVSALLLPANKDLSSSPLPPDDANHYVCYQVKATKDLTDQTPESRPGSGVGKFRKDLQAFFEDQLDDCADDKEGNPSFPASPAAGKCLFDLKKVKELCNPMDKSAVESPRETSATITPSAATTQHSLLCYQPKLARKFTSTAAAGLANAIVGDKIEPGQAKHTKRGVKTGDPLHTAPGNLFPNPVLVDTSNHELVCIPTDVASVAPATP